MAIICLNSISGGRRISDYIKKERKSNQDYLVPINQVRFSNGEAKLQIKESVRGKDVYIIADIGNWNIKYKMFGQYNFMSPDDHMADIKRCIGAIAGRARRVNVIMPLLYGSRQHRKKSRESLDCAQALQELVAMGVINILTFDVHDPNVANAIPNQSLENVMPTPEILKHFIKTEGKNIDKDKMIIISPDIGATERAIIYATSLGLDMGLLYKRRDLTVIVNGQNPIVESMYLGKDIKGMVCVVIDDMIASGGSILKTATDLKNRGAKEVIIITSFALFNDGIGEFEKYHKEGFIKKIYTTNLTYVREEAINAEWIHIVDMTDFVARIINMLNKEDPMSTLLDFGIKGKI